MTHPTKACCQTVARALVAALILCLSSSLLTGAAPADPEKQVTFDLAADKATRTLKLFSAQSGQQLLYSNADLAGVTTNEVKGAMSVDEALKRLLAGTPLTASRDSKNGAVAVGRASPEKPGPNVQAAAPKGDRREKATKTEPAPDRPAAARETNEDTMLQLSPFVVTSQDDGYTAANSLMGGRISTALKDVPASVSVITRQFLDDIAATNPFDVAEWTMNLAQNYEGNTSSFSTYQYNIRSLGNSFASRNYVLWYGYSDDFNTERYEFARGPNGTVYGDANVGGIPTTWSKRALPGRNRTVAKTTADSYGGWRAALDHNQPLGKDLEMRVNLVRDHMPTWDDAPAREFTGGAMAATWRVTPNDELRVDGELAYYVYPFYSHNNLDQASFWNGTTTYGGGAALTAAQLAGTGVAKNPTSYVYIPGAPNGGLNDMSSFYRTTGTNMTLYPTARTGIPNFPMLPSREFVLNPSDALSRLHQYFYAITYMHRFSDNLFAEIAYTRHDVSRENGIPVSGDKYNEYRIDVNTTLPGGGANPNFGKPYQDREVKFQLQGNNVTQAHALVNWRFTKSWINQNFVGMVGTRLDRARTYQTRLTRTNGTNPLLNNAANIVLVRRYWDQAGLPLGSPVVPPIPGVDLEFVLNSASNQRKAVDFAQISSVSRLFNERLALMLGFRNDHVIDSQNQTANIPLTANGLPQLGAVIVTPTSGARAVPVVGAKIFTNRQANSKNAGAVYWLRPWLGLVANYAQSIASNTAGAALLDGTMPGIVRNDGTDLGLRLELFDGRLSGNISHYKNRQVGALLTAGLNTDQINRLWDNIGRLDVPDVDYRDTQDKDAQGWEIEFTGNPLRNLRLSWNLALPESTVVNIRPQLTAYFAEHAAVWQAGADDPLNPQRAAIQTDINAIKNTLNGATPGTPVNDTYKYQSNIYATYSFREGWLKNFEAGGGVNFRGKNKVAADFFDPYKPLYSPAYHLVSAHISYTHKFGRKLSARFQLNVRNLLDEDSHVFLSQDGTGYGTYVAGGVTYQVTDRYRQQDPRKFIFSTTVEF
jgi:hypothetical protein